MTSKIKSEIYLSNNKIYLSNNEIYSLDITVSIKHGKLRAIVFTKPTDSYFYQNTSSCYPSNVLKNTPRG